MHSSFSTVLRFLPIAVVVGVLGCVDIDNVNVPPTVDYRATARFIHVASDNPSAGNVTVDGVSVGSLSYGQAGEYMSIQAGSRSLAFAGTTQSLLFDTDQQYTVLVHAVVEGDRFLRQGEGYNFANYGVADVARVRFVNVAVGAAPQITFREGSPTGTPLSASVPFGTQLDYVDLTPGTRTVWAVSDGDTASVEASFAAGRLYTVVAAGSGSNLRVFHFPNRQVGVTKVSNDRAKETIAR